VKLIGPLLSGTVLSALAAAPAVAADIPARPPVAKAPAAVALFNWSGFYVGANIGGAWGKSSADETAGGWFTSHTSVDPKGVIGGLQAGQNWQVGNIVYGVEADIDVSSAKDSTVVLNSTPPVTHESKLTALATLRGRVGIAADRTLFFLTAGGAYGWLKSEIVDPNNVFVATRDSSAWGWVVGGGIEQAFAHNWTARVEFLHARLANDTNGPYPLLGYVFRFKDSVSIARAAINYRF
jgi:outer membrane immunogenic protein